MRTTLKSITTEKENGRVYTPKFIVDNILDLCSYYGPEILKKHVIDNSCGDGAFLCEIVRRYCEAAIEANMSATDLKKDLEEYIHGIELEYTEIQKCQLNVSAVAETFGIKNVNWAFICGDSLKVHDYDGRMDYVLGNPPYVRVHNLGESFDDIKNFHFSKSGMTDLFIVFYELGIRMLNDHGTLGYITPSSFYNSIAGAAMRKVFVNDNLLDQIVNLKHFQAFNATTYTTIVVLKKQRTKKTIDYYGYDGKNLIPYYIDTLTPEDFYIAGNFYFAKKEDLAILHKVFYNGGNCEIMVKNGYATLCDDVFIHDFNFDSEYIIPVIKASKGIKQRILFPYDKLGKLLPEAVLMRDKNLSSYLLANKEKLLKRSNDNDSSSHWYSFGRSQAINDTYHYKIAINSLLRDENDIKFTEAPEGVGVYSGLYILSGKIKYNEIEKALKTREFSTYIELLGKYKSGGYYTFSSKDLKKYMDYKFNYNGGLLNAE